MMGKITSAGDALRRPRSTPHLWMTKLLPFLLPLVAMVSYLLLSLPASGQTTAQDLSPEANKALQKGMIAEAPNCLSE